MNRGMDGMFLISLDMKEDCRARMSYMKEEAVEARWKGGSAEESGVRGIYASSLWYWV